MGVGCLGVFVTAAVGQGAGMSSTGSIDLPTSKQIGRPAPGAPQRTNGLPMSMAVSPDGRWVVTVDAGYGTWESGYRQSLSVVDTRTGAVVDSPDERTMVGAKQTLYSGLAFSGDGRHLYGSVGSISDPEGKEAEDTGSGVVVYGFADGKLTRERVVKIPLQKLAAGRKTKLIGDVDGGVGVPFPAGVAVVPGSVGAGQKKAGPSTTASRSEASGRDDRFEKGEERVERLLVADNLSDDVLLMDVETGKVVTRFDLSESDAVPGTYPFAVAVSRDGTRGFVTLWNASEVVELDLVKGVVGRKLPLLKPSTDIAPGTHPCALEFSPDGRTMYVALANRDAVAAVDVSEKKSEVGAFAVKGYFDTRLPGQSYFGAEPEALAVSSDGRRLYVGNAITDAVAVIDTTKADGGRGEEGVCGSRSGLCRRSGCRCRWGWRAAGCGWRRRRGMGQGRTTLRNGRLRGRRERSAFRVHQAISGRCCMGRWRGWI